MSLLYKIKKSDMLKTLYKILFQVVGRLPARKNLIMFESYLGKQYSDNPRAIYEYIKENHPEYKMFWSVDKRFASYFIENGIPYANRFSVKWLFKMAMAKYWVSNSRLPLWIPKPEHTTYLQTWHGTPLKRLAMDMDQVKMPGTNTKKYKRNFTNEAKRWDYLISPNAYSTDIFRSAFQFDKVMIESGYPRNDYLYQENNEASIQAIKEKLKLPLDKKIILYAPTWRDNEFYGQGRYKFKLQLDLDRLRAELGEEYIFIMRMHYLVVENFDLSAYEGFAYDFSKYEDIRDLYLISDMLITDYSSVFFDYANLSRPMIFFVYDIESYRDNLRGFYFDFEEKAPGPLVKTTEEVIKYIKEFEEDGSLYMNTELFREFHERFCSWESGQSSKRVVERVFLEETNEQEALERAVNVSARK